MRDADLSRKEIELATLSLKPVRTLAVAAALMSAAVLATGGNVRAQDATPVSAGNPATISVNGTGTVSVEPDAASVTLGVTVIQPTLAEAQAQATAQMTAVLAALTEAGIEAKDIQTSSYSVNIMQDYDANGMPARVTGFQVSNLVSVTVRDLSSLGEVLDSVVTAGANTVWGITYIVTDSSAAAEQARIAAVADAKDHAEQLAEAVGGSLGRVISVNETYSPIASPMGFNKGGAANEMSAVPIQAGSSLIQVSVAVTYELVN